MCGIFMSLLACKSSEDVFPSPEMVSRLKKRGPDSFRTFKFEIHPSRESTQAIGVVLVASVLSLRDHVTTVQPLWDDCCSEQKVGTEKPNDDEIAYNSHVIRPDLNVVFLKNCNSAGRRRMLIWNGEAWNLDGQTITGNDTTQIFDHLIATSEKAQGDSNLIREALTAIGGPYAFCFIDGCKIYFGRDKLGRRSLLKKNVKNGLMIASVSDGTNEWNEIEGIELVDLEASASNPFEWTGNTKMLPWKSSTDLSRELPTGPISFLSSLNPAVHQLHSLLQTSVKTRVKNIPHQFETTKARLAILFSGGLDCTVIAYLANAYIDKGEPIDLLNVAFHNPRVHGNIVSSKAFESCPDRVTARASYNELCQACPDRVWRLVEIDVPYEETLAHRDTVKQLLIPHDTEMDLSIGFALYFAARGIGRLYTPEVDVDVPNNVFKPFETSARVLLSGLGADELFAGYQRHATAFSRHGFSGLLDELQLDVSRLGKRNLGRDDRVISHWSKEARYPYLDEKVVDWAVKAPLWDKCGFMESNISSGEFEHVGHESVSDIEPAKKVLRVLAHSLGLSKVAKEKKRAIQFGARTAKMETGRTKGTHRVT